MSADDPHTRLCPLCDSGDIVDWGPVIHPTPPRVAGVPIDLEGFSFRLKRCRQCDFQFKDPVIPPQRLLDCYRRSAGDNWGENPDPRRRRFDLITQLLTKHAPGRRVLDIGCSNGGLLTALGPQWQRFGIEPGRAAASAAGRAGIDVLGPDIESVDPGRHRFDVITAIDLVEHLVDPRPFFRRVTQLLEPGGVFLIVTGDTDAWTWRCLRGLYWYVSIPEHTSFWCRAAIDQAARQVALQRVDYARRSHQRQGWRRGALEWMKNGAYALGRGVKGLGVPRLRRAFLERGAPGWLSAPDHMFCILRKGS